MAYTLVSFASTTPTLLDSTPPRECASPQIALTVGFSPLTVYVACEFPTGGCAGKEIYEHGMRHLKTCRRQMASIEKALGETLKERFATGAPWRGPLGQTAGKLQREPDERWPPCVQRELKRVDTSQARIDTPAEYERVANACGGAIKKRTR